MRTYEMRLWDQQFKYVAGIDEVGRGCLCGDVVAAAVILPPYGDLPDVRDSKTLSEKKREQLYEEIHKIALDIGVGVVDAATIDRINIKQAAKLAMERAILQLKIKPEYLLIDAESLNVATPQLSIVKGDQTSLSIAAASIIAKVTRDRMCIHWDRQYPEYGIAKHKGYATKQHREAIQQFGPSPLHRTSFLKNIVYVQQTLFDTDN